MAVLKVVRGGPAGQVLELQGERTILGRHPQCQIVLDNAAVSRHHAQIVESHNTYYLEDLRSRNGTQVNGESIRGRVELRDGDDIKLCDYQFIFQAQTPRAARRVAVRLPAGNDRGQIESTQMDVAVSDGELPVDEMFSPVQISPGDRLSQTGSSILTTLEATSSASVRFNVRPEVKLRAVLEISLALRRTLRLDDVLATILESLFRIFPQAEWGFVLLKDSETNALTLRATRARIAEEDDQVPVSTTIVRQAMETGQAILSADALGDQRFDTSESLAALHIRSVMCAPLCDASGTALGVIQLSTRDISQQFSADDLDLLTSVGSQASMAVENARMHESLLQQHDLERDLEFATQVQLGFLPSHSPTMLGFELADYYEPANRVGGDYFDYVPFPDGRVAVAVGDVAGKGLPAALLMARLHAAARYQLLSQQSAGKALEKLNSELGGTGAGFRFITLVLAVIDPLHHTVQLASAGHLPPLLKRVNGAVEQVGLNESSMPLGIVPTQSFSEVTLRLEPGEQLVFYTDGVTEAMDADHQLYGWQRLANVLKRNLGCATDVVNALVNDVEEFYGQRSQRDDLCVVVLRRQLTPPETEELSANSLAAAPEEI